MSPGIFDSGVTPKLIKRWGIALTGGVATGKSTVAAAIRAAGYPVIDADALARDVVAPGTPGLAVVIATFGQEFLADDGSLNRKKLGQLVFADPEARRRLEQITHPLIHVALADTLERLGMTNKPRWFFYEAALIVEVGRAKDFAAVWCTICPPHVQEARLSARDGISPQEARQIIANQMPAAEKTKAANLVIDTSQPLEDVKAFVAKALSALP